MFDIGFWELALIAVIALIVLGPERLPGAARTLGLWVGRARRYSEKLRVELEDAAGAQDLRRDFDSFRSEIDSVRGDMIRGGRQLRAEVEGDEDAAPEASGPAQSQTDSQATTRADTDTGPDQAGVESPGAGGRRLQVETRPDDSAQQPARDEPPKRSDARPVASDADQRG